MPCITYNTCNYVAINLLVVMSFLELVPYLFKIPGVKVFLSEKLCQDPLEMFFGRQQQRGRVNENPNAQTFCKNTQALRVVSSCVGSVKGNCRGSKTPTIEVQVDKENKPLPKHCYTRKRLHSDISNYLCKN